MARTKKAKNVENGKELEIVNAAVEEAKEAETQAEAVTHEFAPGGEALELNIEAELFSGLRAAFNETMQKLLGMVTGREVDEGEINVKLTISLENQNVLGRTVAIPTFRHVVTGNYKEKIECKGTFGIPQTYLAKNSNGEYELKALQDDLFSAEPVDAEIKEATV